MIIREEKIWEVPETIAITREPESRIMKKHWILMAVMCLAMTPLASANFIAYNDFVDLYTSDPNVTHWSIFDPGAKALKDEPSGNPVTPTMTATQTGMYARSTGPGSEIAAGTDAATIFSGKVSTKTWTDAYTSVSTPWSLDLEFKGLDPAKTYNLAAVIDRGGASYANKRWTLISLLDVEASTYACSSGAYQVSATVVSIDSYNTLLGYVAKWTGIQPGADGDLTLRVTYAVDAQIPEAYRAANEEVKGYGPAGIMLEEVPEPATMGLLALGALAVLRRRRMA